MSRKILSIIVLAALLAMVVPAVAGAAVADNAAERVPRVDKRPDPLGDKQEALREVALQEKLNGKAYGKVAEVARGQFVELTREGEDAVWTVPGEFADFPHNSIAEPNRAYDNTTIWVPDFSREYFLELLFDEGAGANSMRQYYIEQSSGRYTVHGDVTDWVPLPNDAAYYDDNKPVIDPDTGEVTYPDSSRDVWYFLEDSLNGWYDMQIASGKTPAQIDAYLAQFDVWDRYDHDHDGDYDESDGYIDHFQSLHSGEGEEAGGGALGSTAIWSHSWYANQHLFGIEGPSADALLGGVKIGGSNYWVGDYTIQPENGGVGVFTHEFAHDLGLPDLYDTAAASSAQENGTGFWTLMSSGSWMGDGAEDIGSKSSHMGAWEKFQLGWLNYEVARAGLRSSHKLGPLETTTKQAQGIFVILPKKSVTAQIGTPYAGEKFYYSGAGDELDNVMYKSFDLAAGSTLTAKVNYQIELDWDYAYVVVSTNGGTTWTSVPTNLSTNTDPNGQNKGFGITGSTGGSWIDLEADLSAYTGPVLVGLRYWTDVAATEPGLMADEITVTGYPTDGAETDAGWTYVPAINGFRVTTGTESGLFNQYYVVESRQYRGYDSTLKTGPYNFGFLDNDMLGNFVEHFAYQDGVLINYWDTSQNDNNVSTHPGQGMLLPIDAHPTAMARPGGGVWRARVQTFDATFGLEPTDAITLHNMSAAYTLASQPAVATFKDTLSYYDATAPYNSVIVPVTGTQIKVTSASAQGNFLQVQVSPVK